MKNKQSHFLKGSFALLLFMILGYVVKFYPENLVGIDQPIQSAIRGDLPAYLTAFFTRVTVLMNTPVVASWVGVIVLFFVWKKWYTEALLLTGSLVTTGLLVVILKHIYLRPRPALQHLVQEGGYSFPSGHSLAATLVFGRATDDLSSWESPSSACPLPLYGDHRCISCLCWGSLPDRRHRKYAFGIWSFANGLSLLRPFAF